MTQRSTKRKPLPPAPKLPEGATDREKRDYVLATFERDKALARTKPVRAYKRPAANPEGRVENLTPPEVNRYSLKASVGTAHQRCKYCKRVCVKGMEVCWHHGGQQVVAERWLARGLPPLSMSQIRRNTGKLIDRGLLPYDLVRQPLFQELNQELRAGNRQAAHVLRELIIAWLARDDGNFELWIKVLAEAKGFGYGQQNPRT